MAPCHLQVTGAELPNHPEQNTTWTDPIYIYIYVFIYRMKQGHNFYIPLQQRSERDKAD